MRLQRHGANHPPTPRAACGSLIMSMVNCRPKVSAHTQHQQWQTTYCKNGRPSS
ncbi:hypothetical protein B0H12DRAFT_1165595 [Mycena haematopus]|nr:hypothetical protein B0H12DRAFT_1165595 [Mycena haematopus]